MKKLILIFIFVPLYLWGVLPPTTTPVKVNNPYIFDKYIKVNDSTILKNIKLVNMATLPVTPDKPSIAAHNDTIWVYQNGAWAAIGSGGGTTYFHGNAIGIVNDTIELGGRTGTGNPLTHNTYIGDLGVYDYIIYNSCMNYVIDSEHSQYQFQDSVLNVNNDQGIEYQNDISTYIKSTSRGIPDMATVRSVIHDSISAVTTSTIAGNGLSKSGDTLKLGGPIYNDISVGSIADDSFPRKRVSIYSKGLYLDNGGSTFSQNDSTIGIAFNQKGAIEYSTDNSPYFKRHSYSVPDFNTVKNTISDSLAEPKQHLYNELSNGIKSGFTITINADPTKINISSGKGEIINNTSPLVPIHTHINYAGGTAISVTNILTATTTYLAINSSGTIVQQTIPYTPTQRRSLIILGTVVHSNRQTINAVNHTPDLAISIGSQLFDLEDALRMFNISGNVITANGANLSIDKSDGYVFKKGANYSNDPANPSTLNLMPLVPSSIRYRLRDGTEYQTKTVVNPDTFDNAGVKTVVTNGKFTAQRIVVFPSNLVRIQYGQKLYNSMADAIDGINQDTYVVEPTMAANGILRAIIIIKKGTSSLQSAAEAKLLEVDRFGGTQATASSSSTGTLQSGYNNSTKPQIVTSTALGQLQIMRGSASDADTVLQILNGSSISKFSILGSGKLDGDTANNSNKGLMSSWDHTKVSTTLYSGGASTASQVPFWTGIDNKVSGHTALTFDSTNKVLTVTKNSVGVTQSGGIVLTNSTVAILGATVQAPPYIKMNGQVWDTDDFVSRLFNFKVGTFVGAGGTNPSGQFAIGAYDHTDVVRSSITFSAAANGTGVISFVAANGTNTTGDMAINSSGTTLANTGYQLTNSTAATGTAPNKNRASPVLRYRCQTYNGSVNTSHFVRTGLTGIADGNLSQYVVQYSPDNGTTYNNAFTVENLWTGTTAGAGNNFYMGNGASQTAPALFISTPAGSRSMAIGADASNTNITYDDQGSLVFGTALKADIDNHLPATTAKMTLTKDGYLGIGASNPSVRLHTSGTNNAFYFDSDNNPATWALRYCNGTIASPSNVSDGNITGLIRSDVYSGSSYSATSQIKFKVDGTFTSGQRPPSAVSIWTNKANNSPAENFIINNTGNVGIGTITPKHKLSIFASTATDNNALNLVHTTNVNRTTVAQATDTSSIYANFSTTGSPKLAIIGKTGNVIAIIDSAGLIASNGFRGSATSDSAWVTKKYFADNSVTLRTAGNSGIGAIKYNGTTAVAGQMHGGNNSLTGGIVNRLNYNGELYANSIVGNATTTDRAGVFVSDAGDAIQISSNTGKGIWINQTTGNTSNLLDLNINSVQKANIDYTGKGTFNGGISNPSSAGYYNQMIYSGTLDVANFGHFFGGNEVFATYSARSSTNDASVVLGNPNGNNIKIASFKNAGVEKAYIGPTGGLVAQGVTFDSTIFKTAKGGGTSLFLGLYAGNINISTAIDNIGIGTNTMAKVNTGKNNTVVGSNSFTQAKNYTNVTALGANVLSGNLNYKIDSSIFIGASVTGIYNKSNQLRIDNKPDTVTTFITGDMAADTLRINAQTRIGKGANYVEMKDGDLKYKFRHGKAFIDSVVGYSVTGTRYIYYKINPGAMTIVDTLGITIAGDSLKIQKAGTYIVRPKVAAITSNTADQLRVKCFKNNAIFSPALESWVFTPNATGGRSSNLFEWYLKDLSAGDWLSFRIQNQSGNRAITITDFSFYIEKVPE